MPRAPDTRIRRWIDHELAVHPPRANSLIVTVWGDALAPHGGVVWLSTLFRLLAPYGLNERLVRTSVFRLARDGWLAAESVGRRSRYRLTADGARRFKQAYRRVYAAPSQRWNRSWEIVVAAQAASRADKRRALRSELGWEGFGTLAQGLYARPARRDSALRRILAALDLGDAVTVFDGRDTGARFGRALADRLYDAWPLGELEADYRGFISRFAPVTGAWRSLADGARNAEQTFIVRTLLVHAYRRVRLRDPQLPRELLPPEWPGSEAYALCRDFYRLALPVAEQHLAAVAAIDGERLAPPLARFGSRFASR